MRKCIVCGRDETQTTVVVDHRDEYFIAGERIPERNLEICLSDYKAQVGRDWDGPIPES